MFVELFSCAHWMRRYFDSVVAYLDVISSRIVLHKLSAVLSSVLLNKCGVVPVSGTRIVCNLDARASDISSLSCALRGHCIDSNDAHFA